MQVFSGHKIQNFSLKSLDYKEIVMEAKKVIGLIVAGVFIGVVNGFFGGGGGMICVPALLLLGLSNKQAQATAILIMLPISIASAIVYYTNGFIEWDKVLFTGIGSVIGGIVGAFLLKKLSNNVLKYVFAVVVMAAGIRMLF